jgi:hypothetical protein
LFGLEVECSNKLFIMPTYLILSFVVKSLTTTTIIVCSWLQPTHLWIPLTLRSPKLRTQKKVHGTKYKKINKYVKALLMALVPTHRPLPSRDRTQVTPCSSQCLVDHGLQCLALVRSWLFHLCRVVGSGNLVLCLLNLHHIEIL